MLAFALPGYGRVRIQRHLVRPSICPFRWRPPQHETLTCTLLTRRDETRWMPRPRICLLFENIHLFSNVCEIGLVAVAAWLPGPLAEDASGSGTCDLRAFPAQGTQHSHSGP